MFDQPVHGCLPAVHFILVEDAWHGKQVQMSSESNKFLHINGELPLFCR